MKAWQRRQRMLREHQLRARWWWASAGTWHSALADSTDVPLLPRAGERDSVLSAHQGQVRIWLDDAFLESRLVHLEDVVVRRWVLEYCEIITEVDVISLCQRMNLVLVYVHLSIVNAYLGTIHRLRLFAKRQSFSLSTFTYRASRRPGKTLPAAHSVWFTLMVQPLSSPATCCVASAIEGRRRVNPMRTVSWIEAICGCSLTGIWSLCLSSWLLLS